jgi:3',5'-cyclic AMP phosphodiesterase CpdA
VRLVQLSDTHISHRGGTPAGNLSLLVDYLNNEVRPDLVIHTGDIVIADPDSDTDRQAARRLLARIDAPLLVLPGNHDVGESSENPWMGLAATSERVAGYIRAWGPDRFCHLGDAASGTQDWAFIGVNSERMSTGLPEEDEQWDWLAETARQVSGKSVAIFLHKPLWFSDGSRAGITIAERDRERLISLFAGTALRVVANGHVHRYRHELRGDDILNVWAPSLTFAPPADPEHGLGPSRSGVVEYRIDGDAVDASFRVVPGLQGVADATTMPEFTAALAELEATSAR